MAIRRFLPLLVLLLPLAGAQGAVRTEQALASLVAERSALVPGETAWLGLRIEHDPHWHTYWINPGDSGLATRIEWSLPEGFAAGDILWPRPTRLVAGPLTNFGYEGDLLLAVPLAVPESLRPGSEVSLSMRADWLICEEICIPDGADLDITLPVAADAAADPRVADLFATARARAPRPYPGSATIDAHADADVLRIVLDQPPAALVRAAQGVELFPLQTQVLASPRGSARADAGLIHVNHQRSTYFADMPSHVDLLVAAGPAADDPSWIVRATALEASAATSASGAPPPGDAPAGPGFALALLLAFLGGVLLNLMPCVFPVLSLKALGLAESAGDEVTLRRHGWIYTAGVLASFAVLAGALLAVRAGGEAAGWGFQLQQPWFVAILAYVIFVLGLSLSGAVTLGTTLMGLGHRQAARGGDRGAFMTGVLACVVASPCTAPFMGAALGYAVTLPAAAAMAVFLALGFGLAFPLLMISLVPALSRWLPRPGRWMETFKQAMAFPLYLTALWLLWVLGRQTDFETAMTALLGMLLIAFALWLWPLSDSAARTPRRVSALLVGLVSLALVTPLAGYFVHGEDANASTRMVPFNAESLAELRGSGSPVLVNMTADWCITCKVNERAALSGKDFHESLQHYGVHYMVGDWTHSNPRITAYLAEFGRNGVPLYVLYPANGGEPEVLPQMLTPRTVSDALRRAAGP
jgi:thiol:disulfide interchange protein